MCECNVEKSCVECADKLYGQGDVENHDAERESLNDAGRDFYIAGWTPECEDEREFDYVIINRYPL